jgi:hypothetical protein
MKQNSTQRAGSFEQNIKGVEIPPPEVATEWPHADPERPQQRTVRVVAAQVLGGAAIGVGAAVSPLFAKEILGEDDRFAGMAFAALTFGSALAAVPLSRLMSRRG